MTVAGELMVFDRVTGEYMVHTEWMKKQLSGGIAFDGDNVWVQSHENCGGADFP